jgi:hypothetical protein
MATGLILIPRAARAAGLSEKLGTLLAVGTSICGVTAITAAAPIIKARPYTPHPLFDEDFTCMFVYFTANAGVHVDFCVCVRARV